MEELLETYKRRLQTITALYKGFANTKYLEHRVQLATKVACYKVIITELGKVIKEKGSN